MVKNGPDKLPIEPEASSSSPCWVTTEGRLPTGPRLSLIVCAKRILQVYYFIYKYVI